jgi:hypothetical protein
MKIQIDVFEQRQWLQEPECSTMEIGNDERPGN